MVYQRNIGGDGEIFYANNATGSWISEQVTDNATNDVLPWFALDKAGNPHIVFLNGTELLHQEVGRHMDVARECGCRNRYQHISVRSS